MTCPSLASSVPIGLRTIGALFGGTGVGVGMTLVIDVDRVTILLGWSIVELVGDGVDISGLVTVGEISTVVGEGETGMSHSSPVNSGKHEQLKLSPPRSIQSPLPLQFTKSQMDIGGEGVGEGVGEMNTVEDGRRVSHSTPV